MEKLIIEDKVAVLYSRNLGWSTRNPAVGEYLCMDKELAEILFKSENDERSENEARLRIANIVKDKYPNAKIEGYIDLSIKWVDCGSSFMLIQSYGEKIEVIKKERIYVA